jgi:hypothetical protein
MKLLIAYFFVKCRNLDIEIIRKSKPSFSSGSHILFSSKDSIIIVLLCLVYKELRHLLYVQSIVY